MTRPELLSKDETHYHYPLTEDYLDSRHVFCVGAHNSEILEGALEYLETLCYVATEDPPFEGGEFVGRTPDDESISTHFA